MAELDHWHPVLLSHELRRKPRSVRLAGREIVVFRTSSGGLGAFTDRCPHRSMRLSEGWVEGDRLVCAYHGWRWAADGRGDIPATPAARPCARRDDVFDAVERYGAIWVKRAGAQATFPRFDAEGYVPAGVLRHRAAVPFELALDNFIEVEHTPFVHFMLGYSLDQMPQVEAQVTLSDDAVQVVNTGPKRPIPRIVEKMFRIPHDAKFVVEWTARFSPVHAIYDHSFINPRTREVVTYPLRSAVFFNPVGPESSEIYTFLFASLGRWSEFGLGSLIWPPLRVAMDLELRLDMRLLSRLADKRGILKGNVLGRFDKALVASRDRIDRIYRGQAAEATPEAGDGHEATRAARRLPLAAS
ncbi:Rieske 2Fe-2S domain-containing protein [Sorangium cellulosum]|uniref:AmbP n=1 Tax=Sorangium cellulosum TaxID=56 RepID=A1YBR2_SORCE|nr:AmbP [Sorangium cellulosum]